MTSEINVGDTVYVKGRNEPLTVELISVEEIELPSGNSIRCKRYFFEERFPSVHDWNVVGVVKGK